MSRNGADVAVEKCLCKVLSQFNTRQLTYIEYTPPQYPKIKQSLYEQQPFG